MANNWKRKGEPCPLCKEPHKYPEECSYIWQEKNLDKLKEQTNGK